MTEEVIADEATTNEEVEEVTSQSGGEVAQDPNAAFQAFLDSQNDPAELRNAIFQGNYSAEQKSKLMNKLNNLAGEDLQADADKLKSEHEKRLSLGQTDEEKQGNLEALKKGNYEIVEQGLGYINENEMSTFYDIGGNLQTNDKELSTVNKLLAIENANQLMKASIIDKQLLDSTIAALKLYADDPAVKPLLDNLENRRDALTLEEMEKFDYSNVQDLEASIDADIVALRVLRNSFQSRGKEDDYNEKIYRLITELEAKKEAFVKNKKAEKEANF